MLPSPAFVSAAKPWLPSQIHFAPRRGRTRQRLARGECATNRSLIVGFCFRLLSDWESAISPYLQRKFRHAKQG